MHIRQLTAATTAFLRHPRTATIAFYVATAAIVLKLSPSILEFLGCSRTVLMDALYIIYESDTIRAALNLTACSPWQCCGSCSAACSPRKHG